MSSGSPEDPPKAPLEPTEAPDSDSSTLPARQEEDVPAAKDAGKLLKGGTESGISTTTISAKAKVAAAPPHPRDGLHPWRWSMMLFGNMVLTLIGGQFVSFCYHAYEIESLSYGEDDANLCVHCVYQVTIRVTQPTYRSPYTRRLVKSSCCHGSA
jgi:hypothetical protein